MKQYDTYQATDFAQDEAFIRWVRKDDDSKQMFWEEWLDAHPEKADEVKEAFHLVRSLKFKHKDVPQGQIDRIWNKIDSGIQNTSTATVRTLSRRRFFWFSAAAATLLLAGFFYNQTKLIQIDTAYAEQKQHLLPDGTIVYLNTDSEIKYNEKNWDKKRLVTLSGEAFFNVKKGSTFEVKTDQGSVRVLGTSFNVRVREYFIVDCFTGKVEVTTNGASSVKLNPGDGVKKKTNTKSFDVTKFTPESVMYWRKGVVDYTATSLEEVFHEIERQYDISIQVPKELEQRLYSGKITLRDLSEALDQVCKVMQLRYEGSEKSYHIFEK